MLNKVDQSALFKSYLRLFIALCRYSKGMSVASGLSASGHMINFIRNTATQVRLIFPSSSVSGLSI